MSYLGIDLGSKRCGLAIELEGIIVSKGVIARVELVSKIKTLVRRYFIKTIVIGLPYDLYGEKNKQLEKTKKFIEKLKNIFPEQLIVGQDERFTTFEAERIVSEMGNTGKRDDIAAQIILEDYLKTKE